MLAGADAARDRLTDLTRSDDDDYISHGDSFLIAIPCVGQGSIQLFRLERSMTNRYRTSLRFVDLVDRHHHHVDAPRGGRWSRAKRLARRRNAPSKDCLLQFGGSCLEVNDCRA